MVPGEDVGCQVDQLALHTGDTVLGEGHVVADLHWEEGDGVELPDVGELVLPGGKDKKGMS